MKTLTSIISLLIISMIISSTPVMAGSKAKKQKLFNLEISDLNKKDVEINDYTSKSRLTVITFFAEYCSPCQTELDSINKQYIGWKNQFDVNFVAVCVSAQKNITKIQDKAKAHNWGFNILVDDRNEAVNMLRISQIPYTMIVDQNGTIVYQHAGYSAENLNDIRNIIKEGVSNAPAFATK